MAWSSLGSLWKVLEAGVVLKVATENGEVVVMEVGLSGAEMVEVAVEKVEWNSSRLFPSLALVNYGHFHILACLCLLFSARLVNGRYLQKLDSR